MEIRYKYRDPAIVARILDTCHTMAVVGLSSQPARAGYYVPAYMQRHGYRIIPVNPFLESPTLGETVYASLTEIPEPVDLVVIFRRSEAVPPFVEDAIEIGAKAVWLQLGIIHPAAAELALTAGLEVVMSACIMVEHRRWAGE